MELDGLWFCTMLLQSDEGTESERASRLLDLAGNSRRDLGMVIVVKRISDAQKDVLVAEKPKPVYPDGLTPREIEVLNLIAQGQSNKQVAGSLEISKNTVMHHVSRILHKTSSANRAEAAIYAVHKNLLST